MTQTQQSMTTPTQTPRKGLKPGDLVTRGAGTARWVVNFVNPANASEVSLVREHQKSKSGSTRWWDEAELAPVNHA